MKAVLARGGVVLVCLLGSGLSARADGITPYLPEGVPGVDQQPGVTVRSRLQPATDDPGVRVGGALVRLGLDQRLGYDSNLQAEPGGKGSVFLDDQLQASVVEDGSAGRYAVAAALDRFDAFNQAPQSHTDARVAADLAHDFGRDRLTVAASHLAQHETEDQLIGLPGTAPIAYSTDDIRVAERVPFGRLTLEPSLEASTTRFAEARLLAGGTADQRARDRATEQATLTARYDLAERRTGLIVLRATTAAQTERPRATPSLASRGIEALAGVNADLDGALTVQAVLGVEHRAFAAAFKLRTEPVGALAAIWSPSGLTTVTLALERAIEDPAAEGTAGFIATRAALRLDHEWSRALLLRAGLRIARAEYIPGDAADTILGGGAGAEWRLRRGLRLSADLDYSRRDRGSGAPTATGAPGPHGPSDRAEAVLGVHVGL